jgi:hypothetical protein
VWVLWLEAALHKIALAERWVHGIRIVSLAGMVILKEMLADADASEILLATVWAVSTGLPPQ